MGEGENIPGRHVWLVGWGVGWFGWWNVVIVCWKCCAVVDIKVRTETAIYTLLLPTQRLLVLKDTALCVMRSLVVRLARWWGPCGGGVTYRPVTDRRPLPIGVRLR